LVLKTMGTNTDPYQWVESRYKLMPGIWAAMRDARNPCSILTKSPLLLRDIELLKEIAAVTDIHANLSIPTLDAKACIRTQNLPVLDVLDVLRWDVADALSGLASTPTSLDRCSSSNRSREGDIPTCRAHSPGARLEPRRAEVRPSERSRGLRRAIRHGL
jgi:hypothetical protein